MKRGILLSVAVALLVAGIFLGGFDAVWRKASMLCMECIGLG